MDCTQHTLLRGRIHGGRAPREWGGLFLTLSLFFALGGAVCERVRGYCACRESRTRECIVQLSCLLGVSRSRFVLY
jgi:hypothetical protein